MHNSLFANNFTRSKEEKSLQPDTKDDQNEKQKEKAKLILNFKNRFLNLEADPDYSEEDIFQNHNKKKAKKSKKHKPLPDDQPPRTFEIKHQPSSKKRRKYKLVDYNFPHTMIKA